MLRVLLRGACDVAGAYLQDCKIEGRALGCMQLRVLSRALGCMQLGVLAQVLLEVLVMARAHICKIEGRVRGCMQFRVLLRWS